MTKQRDSTVGLRFWKQAEEYICEGVAPQKPELINTLITLMRNS